MITDDPLPYTPNIQPGSRLRLQVTSLVCKKTKKYNILIYIIHTACIKQTTINDIPAINQSLSTGERFCLAVVGRLEFIKEPLQPLAFRFLSLHINTHTHKITITLVIRMGEWCSDVEPLYSNCRS